MRCFGKSSLWLAVLVMVGLWFVLTGKKGITEPTGWFFLFAALLPVIFLFCRQHNQANPKASSRLGRNHWGARLRALLQLVVFFIGQSLFGGFDVARRAFARKPVQPDYVYITLTLQGRSARSLFIALIGLMPGTVTVAVMDNQLRIQRLDQCMSVLPALMRLQVLLARVFADSADNSS